MIKSANSCFDIIQQPQVDAKFRGVVFLNDLDKRSDFIFKDWGVPVIRPKSLECFKEIDEIIDDKNLTSSLTNSYLQELVNIVLERLSTCKSLGQEAFLMMVSFRQEQPDNFDLLFSKNANTKLVEHIEKNFLASNQKFHSLHSHTNVLFKKVEDLMPDLSCFELSYGGSIENVVGEDYSKERIFEETVIFANLTVLKMI